MVLLPYFPPFYQDKLISLIKKLTNALDVSLPELFDFNYLKLDKNNIKQEIIEKLDNLSLKELQIIYRLIEIM